MYRYTFGAPIEVTEPGLTHTVGAYATREVAGVRHVDDDTLDFVPSGAPVLPTACVTCHGQIGQSGAHCSHLGMDATADLAAAAPAMCGPCHPVPGSLSRPGPSPARQWPARSRPS